MVLCCGNFFGAEGFCDEAWRGYQSKSANGLNLCRIRLINEKFNLQFYLDDLV
jgi:hypothetical protein